MAILDRGLAVLCGGGDVIMTLKCSRGTYQITVCGVLSGYFDNLQGVLNFASDVLAMPDDAFYGTLTPISNAHKQQLVLNEIAEFAINARNNISNDGVKKLVPIPFALTDSDEHSMKEFSAGLANIDRLILWINVEDETYDICFRDVFSLFRVFRIIFDIDDTDSDGADLDEWV